MASYLIQNKERFIFSHKTVWCPLRDLESILNGGTAFTTILHQGTTLFFQTLALHYLYQPLKLELISAHDFYSQYEVVRASLSQDGLFQFVNGRFQHPSYHAYSR